MGVAGRRDAGSGGCFKMADVAAGPGPEGAAYWSRDRVSTERNFRARHLLKGHKADVKAKAPVSAAPVPMDAFKSPGEAAGQQVPDKGGMKSASLKDLCPEDKRRIANLIKELARVSEEKEVTEERLKTEQESFEKKIRQLEEQNELIIKEREALQQQYRECQELLSLYQKYLSEQQEKLTHSLSELEAAKLKEQQMSNQRTLCQPLAPLELDGSYLSIARPQTSFKNNRVLCGSPPLTSAAQPCRSSHIRGSAIHGSWQDQNEFLLGNGLHSKCNNVVSPAKSKASLQIKRTPVVDQRRDVCPLQTCFFHKKSGSSDHDSFPVGNHNPKRPSGAHCDSSTDYSCPLHPSGLNGSLDLGLNESEFSKRLSEERRKQLLLQKMELEIEKERLQNLLAKHEAKLLLQQQQLHQSRLDYYRCKGHVPNSEELLLDEVLMRPGGQAPVMNGAAGVLSSPKLNCGGCLSKTPASEKSCRAPGSSGGNSSGKKSVGFSAHAEDDKALWGHTKKETVRPRRGMAPGSRKDAATSPRLTGSRKELVTTATSPIQHDTSRYEASLFDLVEAICPGLQQPQHYTESRSHSKGLAPQSATRRQPGWSRSPPAARNGAAELEESRILEEIFFI
ncbi:protein hinderin isoform X2 [Hemicordylus capensis]|uniref:protein hinderin isoform X2 n=1 Tax=Hemicordylus capensis TaxID=884348 RepID=UPI002302734D|nr:protein hinderin isoform X2 [Hemicordylus capensis]